MCAYCIIIPFNQMVKLQQQEQTANANQLYSHVLTHAGPLTAHAILRLRQKVQLRGLLSLQQQHNILPGRRGVLQRTPVTVAAAQHPLR